MRNKRRRFREKSPNWKGGRCVDGQGYIQIFKPEYHRAYNNKYVYEHIFIAEKVLGKPLPPKAQIHHYGAKDDNAKIVICQDLEYHKLLHIRTEALNSCGNANYRKCRICKKYDDPKNLYIKRSLRANGKKYWSIYHKSCQSKYCKENYIKRKTTVFLRG